MAVVDAESGQPAGRDRSRAAEHEIGAVEQLLLLAEPRHHVTGEQQVGVGVADDEHTGGSWPMLPCAAARPYTSTATFPARICSFGLLRCSSLHSRVSLMQITFDEIQSQPAVWRAAAAALAETAARPCPTGSGWPSSAAAPPGSWLRRVASLRESTGHRRERRLRCLRGARWTAATTGWSPSPAPAARPRSVGPCATCAPPRRAWRSSPSPPARCSTRPGQRDRAGLRRRAIGRPDPVRHRGPRDVPAGVRARHDVRCRASRVAAGPDAGARRPRRSTRRSWPATGSSSSAAAGPSAWPTRPPSSCARPRWPRPRATRRWSTGTARSPWPSRAPPSGGSAPTTPAGRRGRSARRHRRPPTTSTRMVRLVAVHLLALGLASTGRPRPGHPAQPEPIRRPRAGGRCPMNTRCRMSAVLAVAVARGCRRLRLVARAPASGGGAPITVWHGYTDVEATAINKLAAAVERRQPDPQGHPGLRRRQRQRPAEDRLRPSPPASTPTSPTSTARPRPSLVQPRSRSSTSPTTVKDPAWNWNDFYPGERQAATVDGKIIGLPALVDNLALVYNKKLFDAAGVAYPTATWTWDDFRTAAKKLTDASAQAVRLGLRQRRQRGHRLALRRPAVAERRRAARQQRQGSGLRLSGGRQGADLAPRHGGHRQVGLPRHAATATTSTCSTPARSRCSGPGRGTCPRSTARSRTGSRCCRATAPTTPASPGPDSWMVFNNGDQAGGHGQGVPAVAALAGDPPAVGHRHRRPAGTRVRGRRTRSSPTTWRSTPVTRRSLTT